MTERSTEHAMFEIERVYNASPAQVFRAWSDPVAKARWFGPTESDDELELDFRVGGRERFETELPDSRVFGYDAFFQEIVAGLRIVYSYTVDINKARISASLVTVEITPSGEKTRLLKLSEVQRTDRGLMYMHNPS